MHWLKVSNKPENKCELCGEAFHFRTIYATGKTPPVLSPLEIIAIVLPYVTGVCVWTLQMWLTISTWGILLPLFVHAAVSWCLGLMRIGCTYDLYANSSNSTAPGYTADNFTSVFSNIDMSGAFESLGDLMMLRKHMALSQLIDFSFLGWFRGVILSIVPVLIALLASQIKTTASQV